jgi:ABC-type sugar transport system permease subunit
MKKFIDFLLSPIRKFKKLKYKTRTRIYGFTFVLPWVIGFLLFFLIPLSNTIYWGFSNVVIPDEGGREAIYTGFENFRLLFSEMLTTDDRPMMRMFIEDDQRVLISTPMIVVFSLFAGILLNMKFKGRGIARVIFFLPIVLGLDVVLDMLQITTGGDITQVAAETQSSQMFLSREIRMMLITSSGLPPFLINIVTATISQVFQILALSGVQILIFLAGLQSLDKTLYEVAEIEGANKYESFWKITLPMLSPIVLFVTIYTIVDLFLQSPIATEIMSIYWGDLPVPSGISNIVGLASSLSTIYLFNVIAIIGIAWFFVSRGVHRYE